MRKRVIQQIEALLSPKLKFLRKVVYKQKEDYHPDKLEELISDGVIFPVESTNFIRLLPNGCEINASNSNLYISDELEKVKMDLLNLDSERDRILILDFVQTTLDAFKPIPDLDYIGEGVKIHYVYPKGNIIEAKYYRSWWIYFEVLQKHLVRLKDNFLSGQVLKTSHKYGNWSGHRNYYDHNVQMLRDKLTPKYLSYDDTKLFYDLLYQKTDGVVIHFNGVQAELLALLKGVIENDRFNIKDGYWVYFKSHFKMYKRGVEEQVLLSETENIRGAASRIDLSKEPYRALYNLGLDLK